MASKDQQQQGTATGEFAATTGALEALERDFDDVIRSLGGEDNLERFRLEYEKLHRALKKSHESERKLIREAQKLSQEMMANAARIQSALRLSQEDKNTIESLKKEIERAWKLIDSANEKEASTRDTMQQLKRLAASLSQSMDRAATYTRGQEVSLAEHMEQKKELARQKDTLTKKRDEQVGDIQAQNEKIANLEGENERREEELKNISGKLNELRRDFERTAKARERAENQVRELTQVLHGKDSEIGVRTAQLKGRTEAVARLDANIREETDRRTDLTVRVERALRHIEAKKEEVTEHTENATKLAVQVADLTNQIERCEQQTNMHRHEQGKAIKARDLKLKQLRQIRQEKDDHKHEHQLLASHAENLRSQISILEKEIVLRDKDRDQILEENKGVVSRQQDESKKHDKLKTEINAVAEFREVLGREIGSYTKSNAMQRAEVSRLESDRKELAQNASDAMARHQQTVEEGKICQMRIDDLQKQIGDAQKRLEEQKKMYEGVRNERNTHSKNLIESQDEIAEMKQKHKILEHQLDQLKEELSAKEKQFHEAVSSHKTLNEKLDKMNKEKSYYNEQRKTYATQNKRLRQEITQLSKVIEGCDQRLAEQQTRFLTVTNERDILGTQLIRRNDELALLYEKIRIQQSTLNRGEVAYRDRLTDIRMLKLKISELKRNVHMAQVRIRVVDDLKQHVTSLTRQLALERTKVQALSEELENPQNTARWRRLGGEDLRADDKVQRIQLLQRRLIAITEQCVDRDATIQEKDKLFVELKAILARQPGPEVAEQLNVYQQDLRKKNTQLKSMASELNMLSSQQAEHRYEVERLNRELQDLKRKYYEAKMENQKLLVDRNPASSVASAGGTAA